MSAEAIAIVGVGVALLAVLVPLTLTLAAGIRGDVAKVRAELDTLRGDVRAELDTLRADIAALRGDVAEVRRDLHALGERVARIEGTLAGPWRPPVAAVAPAASEPSDETAA